jgi:MFS family permease
MSGTRLALTSTMIMALAATAAALAMGTRQSFGLFLAPMVEAQGWTAAGFGFAIALQVLLNGASQPLFGQLADRYGGRVVVIGGALLQACAILGMAFAESIAVFTFFAGLVLGFAVSAAGMPILIATMTRMLPEEKRGRAAGLGTAGSSFGQFLVVPIAGAAIALFGWQGALVALAAISLLIIPLAWPLVEPRRAAVAVADGQSAREALGTALRSRSFWCLFFGFFVCGMHVSFLAVHLPGFVASCHLPLYVGAGAVSLIGLFNIAGSLISGELTQRWKRRELLVANYALRAVLMGWFLVAPKTTTTVFVFAALMGLLYLSTVPPTIALCARNFGTRWLATIFGLVFLGHQIGGFTGALLGGIVFDRTGSYDLMWLIAALAGAFAALIHLPVRDGPAMRPAAA